MKQERGEYLDLRGRKWREAGGGCIMRRYTKCYSGSKIKAEMDGACSTHGENLNTRDHLEALYVDGQIILEWMLGK
jgi:hypothetical protein